MIEYSALCIIILFGIIDKIITASDQWQERMASHDYMAVVRPIFNNIIIHASDSHYHAEISYIYW